MSKFVARFLGSPPINFIPGRLDGDESGLAVRCGENAVFALPRDRAAALASRAGSDVILGVRPEHITGGSHGSSRREHVVSHNVTIDLVQPTGTRLYGAFALAGTEVLAELQAHDVERPGETIEVLFDMQRAILIDPENERVLGLEWQSTGAVTARAEQLAGLGPAYLSCYFDARHAGAEAMRGFRAVADALGCQLALEAVVPDLDNPGEALRSIAELASAAGVRFGAVAVSPAEDLGFVIPGTVFDDMSPYETLFSAAREAFPDSAVGGGNFMYFTELNRKPPPFEGLDFVIHSTCAIVHAADDRSVTETVQTLPYIINSGRSLFGGKPYCLGPVGIGTRTSPFGGGPAPNPHSGRVAMCRNDPRQRGLLGAAWHLGIAARAAEEGVTSLILGAPTGDHGLLHHPGDTPQPWFDEHGGRVPGVARDAGPVRGIGPAAARHGSLGPARGAGPGVRDRSRSRAVGGQPHGRGTPSSPGRTRRRQHADRGSGRRELRRVRRRPARTGRRGDICERRPYRASAVRGGALQDWIALASRHQAEIRAAVYSPRRLPRVQSAAPQDWTPEPDSSPAERSKAGHAARREQVGEH